MRSIAEAFAAVASSLEHYNGLTLTDTTFHHCWSFPPYEYCEAVYTSKCGDSELPLQVVTPVKNCCCGAVKLSDLPAGCEWKNLHKGNLSAIPEAITGLIRSTKSLQLQDDDSNEAPTENIASRSSCKYSQGDRSTLVEPGEGSKMNEQLPQVVQASDAEGTGQALNSTWPSVCDPFLPKLRAVELVNDLACTVLRIAYALTETI